MPDPATSFTAAAVALCDEALAAGPADDQAERLVEDLFELLAQPHLPAPDVAFATGALATALARASGGVDGPLLNDGRDHSDVLHWPDVFGRTWVVRVVGLVK